MSHIKLSAALALVLTLSACSTAANLVVDAAATQVQAGADAVARNLVRGTCAMTHGAFKRELSPDEQVAVDVLCP